MSVNLPSEILQLCFSRLPEESLHKCARVCKRWNANSKVVQDLRYVAKMKEVLIATYDVNEEMFKRIIDRKTLKLMKSSRVADPISIINSPYIQKLLETSLSKLHVESIRPFDIQGLEDLLKEQGRVCPVALSKLSVVNHVRIIKLLAPQQSGCVDSIFRKSSKMAVHTLLKLADVKEVREHRSVMSLIGEYINLRPDCASLQDAEVAFFNPNEDIDLKCQAFEKLREDIEARLQRASEEM